VIRIWAGPKGSAEADAATRAGIVADSRRIAEMAAHAGIVVASEYHRGTLTDTDLSTTTYLAAVGHDNFKTYWQPRVGNDVEEELAGLTQVLPQLAHLHVFHWWPDAAHRLPLAAGADRWSRYLALATTVPGDCFAMLEFVPDDDPALLPAEAATLKQWLKALPGK
jgi:hypothetical protein